MRRMIVTVSLGVIALGLSSCSDVAVPGHGPNLPPPLPNEPLPPLAFEWPQNNPVGVSLSFDDARPSQLDNGVPLLDSYGVKATFYVSLEPLRQRAAEWKAAAASGHEIGNHSLRHACTGNFPFSREKALEDCTLGQMAAELDQANAEIEKLVGVRPQTFAYPCGQKFVGRGVQARSYVPLVAERFLAGRGWRDEMANDPAFCDPAQLLGMDSDGLTWEQLKALIDQARERHAWLVLGGHDIGKEGRQTTRIDTLRAFCEYARDPKNGVWVDTVANISKYIVEHRAVPGRGHAVPAVPVQR
jgi:peptidoglycan/xylan/chitin deacetylase (PgdA/CDA1 family)